MDRYLGESDWDDLDLITTDEARYRFDAEIAELRALIDDGGVDHDDPAVAAGYK